MSQIRAKLSKLYWKITKLSVMRSWLWADLTADFQLMLRVVVMKTRWNKSAADFLKVGKDHVLLVLSAEEEGTALTSEKHPS